MYRTLLAFSAVLFTSLAVVSRGLAEDGEVHNGLPLVFSDDFEKGTDRWETTDDEAWELHESDGGKAFGLNRRKSDYQPEVRSPHNIAMIKDVEVANFVLKLNDMDDFDDIKLYGK